MMKALVSTKLSEVSPASFLPSLVSLMIYWAEAMVKEVVMVYSRK